MELKFDYHSILITVCATISLLGCFLIIISYLIFKKLHTFAFRLITYLSLADLIASVSKEYSGFIIPSYINYELCQIQAITQNYSQLASLFITGMISYSLYEMIVKEKSDVQNHENFFVLISFAIPAILTPLPMITQSYGNSNGWCWVTYTQEIDIFWMIFQFYAELIILLTVSVYFYFRIYYKLWGDKDLYENKKIIKKMMSRLKVYPFVLIICFTPSLIHRIYYLADNEDEFWLNIVAGCFNALYGAGNAIVYGLTSKVKRTLKNAFRELFAKRKVSINSDLME